MLVFNLVFVYRVVFHLFILLLFIFIYICVGIFIRTLSYLNWAQGPNPNLGSMKAHCVQPKAGPEDYINRPHKQVCTLGPVIGIGPDQVKQATGPNSSHPCASLTAALFDFSLHAQQCLASNEPSPNAAAGLISSTFPPFSRYFISPCPLTCS